MIDFSPIQSDKITGNNDKQASFITLLQWCLSSWICIPVYVASIHTLMFCLFFRWHRPSSMDFFNNFMPRHVIHPIYLHLHLLLFLIKFSFRILPSFRSMQISTIHIPCLHEIVLQILRNSLKKAWSRCQSRCQPIAKPLKLYTPASLIVKRVWLFMQWEKDAGCSFIYCNRYSVKQVFYY